jgi:hypothetical protein
MSYLINQKSYEHVPKDKQKDEILRSINKGVYEVNIELKKELENNDMKTDLSDQRKRNIEKTKETGFNYNESDLTHDDKKVFPYSNEPIGGKEIRWDDYRNKINNINKVEIKDSKNVTENGIDLLEEGASKLTNLAITTYNKTKELISKF